MAGPKCPKCGFRAVRITRKSSYLQAKLLPSLGYYPWECADCRAVFMAKNRGPRKKRAPETTLPATIEGAESHPGHESTPPATLSRNPVSS